MSKYIDNFFAMVFAMRKDDAIHFVKKNKWEF